MEPAVSGTETLPHPERSQQLVLNYTKLPGVNKAPNGGVTVVYSSSMCPCRVCVCVYPYTYACVLVCAYLSSLSPQGFRKSPTLGVSHCLALLVQRTLDSFIGEHSVDRGAGGRVRRRGGVWL